MLKIRERFLQEKEIHQTQRPIIAPDFDLSRYQSLDEFKWYVDGDGVHVYFDVYEASSYSEGYIQFLIAVRRHGGWVESDPITEMLRV